MSKKQKLRKPDKPMSPEDFARFSMGAFTDMLADQECIRNFLKERLEKVAPDGEVNPEELIQLAYYLANGMRDRPVYQIVCLMLMETLRAWGCRISVAADAEFHRRLNALKKPEPPDSKSGAF
jgi:hypothetical protein